jgi:glycosyltransferase involved in cell wall biosynthesis
VSAPTVTSTPAGLRRLAALEQRLRATAETLGLDASTDGAEPALAASELYGRLVEHLHGDQGTDGLWLLMVAMSGALPALEDMEDCLRERDLLGPDDFGRWLLEAAHDASWATGAPELEMDVVTDSVVVDVDFSAQHNLHTGIQRVVRQTVPRWCREHDITLVAWTDAGGAMRHLSEPESDRVLHWGEREHAEEDEPDPGRTEPIVVPWHTSLLLPENPSPDHTSALAALARYSGSSVALIGYDFIPVISPELIQTQLPDRFARYLQAVKHAHRVVGISAAATQEFRGFGDMLAAQGLRGPEVVECALPVEVPAGDPVPQQTPPLVLCIGSFEPRKNQVAVLYAAEQLWREGQQFQLEFIGGGGYATEFDRLMGRLTAAGRPVRRRTGVHDDELWRTVRSARFTVFISLHEGFGLPVAESLACGTPCLTSDFGSTREVADGGGALVVDPVDDRAVVDQMRRLLTDDELITRLRDEAAARPPRTWDDYAAELWAAMTAAGTGRAAR